jgi:hypothetical protein
MLSSMAMRTGRIDTLILHSWPVQAAGTAFITALVGLIIQVVTSYKRIAWRAYVDKPINLDPAQARSMRQKLTFRVYVEDTEREGSQSEVKSPWLVLLRVRNSGLRPIHGKDLPSSCTGGGLRLEGSTAFGPTAQLIANQYKTTCPGAHITVGNPAAVTGSVSGLNALISAGPQQVTLCEEPSTGALLQQVAQVPGAIGYAETSAADVYPGHAIQTVELNGMQDAFGQLGTRPGSYQFWTVEYLYTYGDPAAKSLAAAFLGYLGNGTVKNLLSAQEITPCAGRQPGAAALCAPGAR